MISDQNSKLLHECEKSTFKATIGIIYEMTGSEVSQATVLTSTFLLWFTM